MIMIPYLFKLPGQDTSVLQSWLNSNEFLPTFLFEPVTVNDRVLMAQEYGVDEYPTLIICEPVAEDESGGVNTGNKPGGIFGGQGGINTGKSSFDQRCEELARFTGKDADPRVVYETLLAAAGGPVNVGTKPIGTPQVAAAGLLSGEKTAQYLLIGLIAAIIIVLIAKFAS